MCGDRTDPLRIEREDYVRQSPYRQRSQNPDLKAQSLLPLHVCVLLQDVQVSGSRVGGMPVGQTSRGRSRTRTTLRIARWMHVHPTK